MTINDPEVSATAPSPSSEPDFSSKPTEWKEGHLPDSQWESNDLSDPFDDQEALLLPSSPHDEPIEEDDGVVYDYNYDSYPKPLPDLNPVSNSEDEDEDELVCPGMKCGEVEPIADDWSSAQSPRTYHLTFVDKTSRLTYMPRRPPTPFPTPNRHSLPSPPSSASSPSERPLLFPLDTSVPPVPQILSTPHPTNLTLDDEQPEEAEECPISPRMLLL
ncbi:hypothetical protein JAAARDRAFT_198801 [Jaapia argillacea MUCL 33604]|uniref:Uncharacterized protein n=1 Tax=Jaapia argillacea MUCL 33604 TaxID=933084 RepID=A0A067PNN7_9AGAM|nr:hypothetical protein JAAARDRAFT_198801 [Jaapia argillacea MUCL 33604]